MAKIRSTGTRPELVTEDVLRQLKIRYRPHDPLLPGKPDFVLPRYEIAVFVHGCFWHMHSCQRGQSTPVNNARFWRLKRAGNVKRDQRAARTLRRAGWSVITIWECQTKDQVKLKTRLIRILRTRIES